MGHELHVTTCYNPVCRKVFDFDPETVNSVLVDPETGLPPDTDPETRTPTRTPTPEELARSERMPICPECANKMRRRIAREQKQG
ncbi:hypothetical protein ACIBCT_35405 [Streptosporangium sp. NPDC050855]|uniref:hypothetical protein n=1 Tax=Streptosporangium sp. NPDC050855 TaxID=3366194 RepID=UPI0037B93442